MYDSCISCLVSWNECYADSSALIYDMGSTLGVFFDSGALIYADCAAESFFSTLAGMERSATRSVENKIFLRFMEQMTGVSTL
jgi:hypothetical protein